MDDELCIKHWLAEADGLGPVRIKRLLKRFGSAANIYNAGIKELTEVDGIGTLTARSMIKSRDYKKKISKWKSWYEKDIQTVFADEDDYPDCFKRYDDMPYRIFYKGKLPDDKSPTISVVGARGCTSYGKAVALKISETFAGEGWQIISGMAAGNDSYAHKGALQAGGYTCAVLGCGVDICYPSVNFTLYEDIINTGCVMSEFEPGQNPKKENFPVRNRLIAALSDAIIVVEARKKSGSLITADIGLEQGKEVFVVPGRITDPLSMGCIGLLKEGANALSDLNDLRECPPVKRKLKSENREGKEKYKKTEKENSLDTSSFLLYSCLDFTPKSLEYLIDKTSLPKEDAFLVLARLKLEGMIEEVAHNMFVRTSV